MSTTPAVTEPQKVAIQATKKVVETMLVLASGRELAGPVTLQDLFDLEEAVGKSAISIGQAGIDELTKHHFSGGVYMRAMFVPKHTILTGAIHKTEHVSMLVQGDISIVTVDGVTRMCAPKVVHTKPGVKRVGFAHQDTWWFDIHPNPDNERDLGVLWDRYYHNKRPGE